MKSKCASEDLLKSSDLLNPFVHHLELTTTYEKLKAAILTVIVLPMRLGVIVGLLVCAWLLAVAGLIGLTEDELINKPLVGWRREVKELIAYIMCLTYQAGGMSVVIKGKQATRAEAPILVIAPHSSFLDAVIVYVTGFPSIIVRKESGNNPWLGKIINYTQPIYVRREDADSRQKTVQEIMTRVHSKDDWSQMLIFPEGTCTNRSCLITFKPGAFYPGLPIQPVLIRYPNKLDTVTWTWEGPGVLKLMWLTLVQPQSVCEIEFLPVYNPSEEEKQDPKLYAHNVRQFMAKTLGIPTMDYTYDDCKLVSKAKRLSFSKVSTLLQSHQLRIKLGLSRKQIEEKLTANNPSLIKNGRILLSLNQFCNTLGISDKDSVAIELFNLYQKNSKIDLKEYLMSVILVNRSHTRLDMINEAFNICEGQMTKYDLKLLLRLVLDIDDDEVNKIWLNMNKKNKGKLSYHEFENYAISRPEFNLIYGNIPRRLSLPRDIDQKYK